MKPNFNPSLIQKNRRWGVKFHGIKFQIVKSRGVKCSAPSGGTLSHMLRISMLLIVTHEPSFDVFTSHCSLFTVNQTNQSDSINIVQLLKWEDRTISHVCHEVEYYRYCLRYNQRFRYIFRGILYLASHHIYTVPEKTWRRFSLTGEEQRNMFSPGLVLPLFNQQWQWPNFSPLYPLTCFIFSTCH